MKDIITINEASQLWGIASTRIAKLCREGRIEGARKEKKAWLIPADAQRPADDDADRGGVRGIFQGSPHHPQLPGGGLYGRDPGQGG